MFKKVASIASVGALVAGIALSSAAVPTAASAQSFSPVSVSRTFSGSVRLRQSTTVTCTVNVTISINASGAATVTSRSLSGGFPCGSLVVPYGTWAVVAGPSTTQVTLSIGANTILGQPCFGTITVPLSQNGGPPPTSSTITFLNNVIPPVTPGNPQCTILDGSITSTNGAVQVVP